MWTLTPARPKAAGRSQNPRPSDWRHCGTIVHPRMRASPGWWWKAWDALDNFWFTILHETAHAILHYRTGLSTGFFDQTDLPSTDEQEAEADLFAQNILIPDELWRRSTARIANSPAVVERFANDLGNNPAIVFGRMRRERKNDAIFSQNIGRNTVRKLLMDET